MQNREAEGLVPESRFLPLLDELEGLPSRATDPMTGEGLV